MTPPRPATPAATPSAAPAAAAWVARPSGGEAARLAALDRYAVFDTPPEESFDRAVRLAAALFDVPTSFVAFLDADRQWFKASVGLDVCETDREVAFCDRVVRSGAPLVVEDARSDPRFADNPLVTGPPGVRFYAGAPLTTPDGHCVGTLCVSDGVPRRVRDAEVAALRDLAGTVVAELELRREVAERRDAEDRLAAEKAEVERVLAGMDEGLFAVDRGGRIAYLNPQAAALAGGGADGWVGAPAGDLLDDVWPGRGAGRLVAACRRAVVEGRPVEIDVYSGHRDAWYHVRACPHARGLTAFVSDVTERHRAAETDRRREAILEGAGAAVGRLRKAADFHFLQDAGWDDEVHALLGHLGRSTGAARAYLAPAHPAPPDHGSASEWAAGGAAAESAAESVAESVARWADRLGRDEAVAAQAGALGDADRRALDARGARSAVAVPVFAGGEWWGVLGLDAGHARGWAEAEVDALRVVASSLGAAVQRRRSEAALRESEARYRGLVEEAGFVIYRADARGRCTYANAVALRLAGGPGADVVGRPLLSFVRRDYRRELAALYAAQVAEGTPQTYAEVPCVTADGETVWLAQNVRVLREGGRPDGAVVGLHAVARDVTERREAEAARHRSQEELRLLIDGVRDHSVFLMDSDGRVATWNTGAERLMGYDAAEAVGLPCRTFYLADDVAAGGPDETLRRAVAEGAAATEGWRVRKDGSRLWVAGTITALRDEPGPGGGPGRPRGFAVVVRDATEEWEAAERLRQDKDQLQERLEVEAHQRRQDKRWLGQLGALLDRAQDAIWVLDAEGVLAYANRSARQLYGWGPVEWLGRDVRDVLGAPLDTRHAEAFATALAEGEWTGELRQRTRAGADVVVESRWTFVRDEADGTGSILVANTDVTERKALVLRARRVEDLGRLAGGIAHDINNVLGPILMSLQMLAARAGDDAAARKLIGTLESGATRGAGLVRQLLGYMRGARGEWAPVSVVPLVDEVGQILRDTLPSNVALDLAVADGLPPVVADPTQLHQVVMNLAINARDAMPGGGTLAVAVEDRTVDAAEAGRYRDGRVGRFVRVTVADTGVGMPPDVLAKVFDPFFTTKETGTGLGLANVVGIVKGHGGFVVVESAEGVGTRFDVFLPAAATGDAAAAAADAGGAAEGGRGEVVLVVDDNEAMGETACAALEAHGYRTLRAAHGADALDVVEARFGGADPVRAVLTDMMMPVMDGPTLARTLGACAPDLPVIGMSGLTTPDEAAEGGARFAAFLHKPFPADDLLRALDRALAAPPAADPA